LVIESAVSLFGEASRGPAERHVFLNYGFILKNWVDLENRFFPTSVEEEESIENEA
jgi:hypothetical protein